MKRKIVPADTFKVLEYQGEMDQLLLLIAEFMDPEDKEGWAASCFVSDESQLGDFMPSAEQRKELQDTLGFPVDNRDYMATIAARMRQLAAQMDVTN